MIISFRMPNWLGSWTRGSLAALSLLVKEDRHRWDEVDSQAAASRTVVAGEKLNTPFSSVPYHEVGDVRETSKARLFSRAGIELPAGRAPVRQHPAAMTIRKAPSR
jgi:hypothetical protein